MYVKCADTLKTMMFFFASYLQYCDLEFSQVILTCTDMIVVWYLTVHVVFDCTISSDTDSVILFFAPLALDCQ